MPRYVIAQQLGNAVSLPGSNGSGVKSSLVSNSTGDVSAFCWVYLIGAPGTRGSLIKNGETGSGNGGWDLYVNSSRVPALRDPGGVWGGSSGFTLSLTTWYHVGFIRTGTSTQIYVNGTAQGTAASGSYNSPQNDTCVGCEYNDSGPTYQSVLNGYIDDVRIWDRALTANELSKIYTQNELYNPISTTSLKLWLKFDETSGTTATDSSLTGANGTLVGSAAFVTGNVYTSNIPNRSVNATARTLVTATRLSPP